MAFLTQKQQEYRRNAVKVWNVKTGATRSGKTYGDYFMIPKRLLYVHDKPGINVILGNTKGTLQRNIIQPMQDLYGCGLVSDIHSDNTADLFGERCFCLGADNIKHVNRLRGSGIKYCYGDEVTTWHPEVFEMLKSRLDKGYSKFDGTCNPEGPGHWFKRFLDNPELQGDIYQQAYTIDDNPFNDPEVVARMKRDYAGTVYYDRYILGLWAVADGLIYPAFTSCVVDAADVPAVFERYVVSMDYGTMNATAMLLWGKSGRTWYAIDEFYYSGRDNRFQKTDEDYLNDLRKLTAGKRLNMLVIDPSAASFIALATRNGIPVRKADNDVLEGIRETSTAIQRRRILISNRCINAIKEAGGYAWDAKADEDRPVKINDHAMDAMRYMVNTIVSDKRAAIVPR
jgi:PBSX family phage terminase large subunit